MDSCFPRQVPMVFLGCILIVVLSPAKAQDAGTIKQPLQEFFIGEPVFAQDKKEFQLTLKPVYRDEDDLEIIDIPFQVEYGITNRLQVALVLPYNFRCPIIGKGVNGMGNVEIEVLYNILNQDKPFALSVGMEAGLPRARRKKYIAETETEWRTVLIVAKQVGSAQVHAGIAAEITKSESVFRYNLATVLPIGNWRATLELNGQIRDNKTFYLTPGLMWKGMEDFEFGLAFSKSIRRNPGAYGFVLMMTYEFF